MGGSEDVIRAAIEDDRWIGFTAYLPPCIEGVWEEGAIEETGRSCRLIALYFKGIIDQLFKGKGTAETPFASWLEDEIGGGTGNLQRFLDWNDRCKKPLSKKEIIGIVYRVIDSPRTCPTCKELQAVAGTGIYCVEEDCRRDAKAKKAHKTQQIAVVGDEPLTPRGNAERLIRLFGTSMRFNHTDGKWYLWNGSIWYPDDNGGAFRRSEEVVVELYRFASEADDSAKREIRSQWARRCDGMGGYREMLEIAKNKHPITSTIELFDQDPWLFTCQNVTLDLQSGVVTEPKPSHFITKAASVVYDPDAKAPLWDAFLKDVFRDSSGDPDGELISFVQQAVGYSLTGSMAEQMFFFCYGAGANGKSVFLSVIRDMMGDYARQTDFNTFLVQRNESVRNDVAALAGARFVTALESEEGKRLAMALIKAWTGGDPITARFLHQEYFTFNPVGKLWFASNTKPMITERNKGAWRRVCMIPFTVSIPPEMQDPDLEDKLLKELPGIFNWALDGLKKYLEVGKLELPSGVTNATKLYREEYDSIGSFIQSRVKYDKNAYILGKELYSAYEEFCEEAGYTPLGKRKFNQEIESEPGVMKSDFRQSIKWIGIELLGETIETVSNVSYVSRNLGFSYVKEIIGKNLEMDSHNSQTHIQGEIETVGDFGPPSQISQILADHIRKGTPIRTREHPDYDELEMLEALDAGGWTEKRGVWWPPSEEKR